MSCTHCSNASPELKLYQAFIFSVPVFFTFILLLLFYVFYLRRRRASWQSMRMRASGLGREEISRSSESGIKKEVREMLPVVVFKESLLIRETLCSVCLGDYQSEDRLQRIPVCGHTFHIDCIDHWLSTNTTCPLCRVSLLPPSKAPPADAQPTEAQLHQQSAEGPISVSVVVQENVAEEEPNRVCSSTDVFDNMRNVEVVTSHGESSVTIVIESSDDSLGP